jgi:hypothetical protein
MGLTNQGYNQLALKFANTAKSVELVGFYLDTEQDNTHPVFAGVFENRLDMVNKGLITGSGSANPAQFNGQLAFVKDTWTIGGQYYEAGTGAEIHFPGFVRSKEIPVGSGVWVWTPNIVNGKPVYLEEEFPASSFNTASVPISFSSFKTSNLISASNPNGEPLKLNSTFEFDIVLEDVVFTKDLIVINGLVFRDANGDAFYTWSFDPTLEPLQWGFFYDEDLTDQNISGDGKFILEDFTFQIGNIGG